MSARHGAGGPGVRMALGVAAVLGAVSGIVGVLAAGTAAAQTASSTLGYTCTFPTIGGEPVTATISMDVPPAISVGESSPQFAINALATVNSTFAFGLRYILGVRTIEGTLDAATGVSAPQGEIAVPVHMAVSTTSIPASGSFDIPATGTAPSLTFSKPGSASVTAGAFTLHLVPLDANGNITYPGRINVPCTLNPGQNNVVASFDITGATTSAPTTAGPTASGPTASGPGASGSTASGAPSATGEGKPSVPATTAPTAHATTGPPTPVGSGTATASSAATATPDPSTLSAAASKATPSSGPSTWGLILIALGVLALAAVALRFGPRLRNRRNPDDTGQS